MFLSLVACSLQALSQKFVFPVQESENGRYLMDQQGVPFFYSADTAWKLFIKLNKADAVAYLIDRKEKGFTALQVMLTGFVGEKDVNGQTPFADPNDFGSYNLEYFEHVKWVINKADSLNLLMGIPPLWAGCCGEGFAGSNDYMKNNGVQKSEEFGRFIGQFFREFDNIVWIIGGDNDPHDSREEMAALATGIRATAPHHLLTYHASSTHSSTDVWEKADWMDFSLIYTYFRGFNKAWNKVQPDVYEVGFTEFRKDQSFPFILGESTYEGEHGNWGPALQIRKQAFWAALSGATGHAYGSKNWNFPEDWKSNLDLEGAISIGHMKNLWYSRPWQLLHPDMEGYLISEGAGAYASNDYTVSAIAHDRSFSFTYVPSSRQLSVDLNQLAGKRIKAWWYNPKDGSAQEIGIFKRRNKLTVDTPGTQDRVLVLEDAALEYPAPGKSTDGLSKSGSEN